MRHGRTSNMSAKVMHPTATKSTIFKAVSSTNVWAIILWAQRFVPLSMLMIRHAACPGEVKFPRGKTSVIFMMLHCHRLNRHSQWQEFSYFTALAAARVFRHGLFQKILHGSKMFGCVR